MNKYIQLSSWQYCLPWMLAGLLFVSTSGTGAPVQIGDGVATSPLTEERSDSHHRVRRVVGGQPENWSQYPWLAGLEQISRKERTKLLETSPAPVLSTTSEPDLSTTTPITTTTALLKSSVPTGALPSVLKIKKYKETSDFNCSAVLVHRSWAMTAAHCVDDNKKKALSKFVKLTFLDTAKDKTMVRTSRFYLRHPDFRDKSDRNDIAFILLDKPVDNITPVKIDWRNISDDFIESDKPKAKVCGWGRKEARKDVDPDRLQCASLNLVTGKLCNKHYNPFKHQGFISFSDSELCAGNIVEKKDACYGDSGGPLFKNKMNPETEETEAYLIGIVTHGERCGKKRRPGIYARLSHFEHFGKSILRDGVDCDYVYNFLTERQREKVSAIFSSHSDPLVRQPE
ncbi:S1 family serine peptidase [Endozoicomonas lisbonensis]|uniref:Peptidase S1 domain-containing protein n=1 Tax=Endozoicomonas lisbonensis TaxID=3120522 RepID=A0ABV2SC04_9GAMM